jgi:hemerythrin-like domain-containing protein
VPRRRRIYDAEMATMSMNRVIHSAVRRDLVRLEGALTSFTPGDHRRADQLHRAWTNFESELTHHHEGEHEIAWPAMEALGVSPAVLAEMDAEHAVMADALTAAGQRMEQLRGSPDEWEVARALEAVRHLRTVTEAHLAHEEREIEPVYLEHRDSGPVREMARRFSRAQNPARAGRFFAWVTDGATPEEVAAVREDVPGPVLTVLTGLFGRGYRREIAPTWTT